MFVCVAVPVPGGRLPPRAQGGCVSQQKQFAQIKILSACGGAAVWAVKIFPGVCRAVGTRGVQPVLHGDSACGRIPGRCLCSDIALQGPLGIWWLLPAPPQCFRTPNTPKVAFQVSIQPPAPCARQTHLGSEQAPRRCFTELRAGKLLIKARLLVLALLVSVLIWGFLFQVPLRCLDRWYQG